MFSGMFSMALSLRSGWLLVSVLAVGSLVSPASAQTANELLQNPQGNDLQGSINNGSFSVLNLVNQINLSGGTSAAQFEANQQRNLNQEFANFRDRQRQPVGPEVLTPPANNGSPTSQPAIPQQDNSPAQ